MTRPWLVRAMGILFVLHGLAHTRAAMRAVDAASGLLPGPHDGPQTAWVAALLWAVAAAGFVAAGLGLLGVLPFARRTRTGAGIAAAASLALFGLFRPAGAALGAAIDVALLGLLAAPSLWPAVPLRRRPGRAWPRRIASAAGLCFVLYLALLTGLRPWYSRWGSTRDELRARLPGDELVAEPVTYAIQHAVTIGAPADSVWPWLAQMGHDRGGFYSYAGLENLFGLHIRNADRVHPEWQDVAAGDTIYCCPPGYLGIGHRLGWRVLRADPGEALVLENWGAFVVRPVDARTSRLIVRTRGDGERASDVFLAPVGLLLFDLPHFVMERRMLLTIKDRVEHG
jgi:hypothetical protein